MDFHQTCILLLWRSGSGLLMGKFCQFLTELPACNTSIFSSQANKLSKSQQTFTQLDICIDIVEIWFWIATEYISSIFDRVISPLNGGGIMVSFLLFHTYLPKFCTLCMDSQNLSLKSKWCIHWSDCSFRSHLIWACPVCICLLVAKADISKF